MADLHHVATPHDILDARDALIVVLLPAPHSGLPALGTQDRRVFWARFDGVAPLHLRLALRGLAYGLVWVYPMMQWPPRPWSKCSVVEREALLRRFSGIPGLGAALDLVKVVACFAYFDEDGVQDDFRRVCP